MCDVNNMKDPHRMLALKIAKGSFIDFTRDSAAGGTELVGLFESSGRQLIDSFQFKFNWRGWFPINKQILKLWIFKRFRLLNLLYLKTTLILIFEGTRYPCDQCVYAIALVTHLKTKLTKTYPYSLPIKIKTLCLNYYMLHLLHILKSCIHLLHALFRAIARWSAGGRKT